MCNKYNKRSFAWLVVLLLAIWATEAQSARFRFRSQRQEAAPDAAAPAPQTPKAAPYPSADDLKPDIPFEDGAQPDQTYGPPDLAYGPPAAQPDQTYGPPDNTIEQLPTTEDPQDFTTEPDAEEIQVVDAVPARLLASPTFGRRSAFNQQQRGRVQPLRSERLVFRNRNIAPDASVAFVQPLRSLSPAQAAQLQLQYWN